MLLSWRVDRLALLVIPGLLILLVIYAWPLMNLLVVSFVSDEGQWNLSAYTEFLTDDYHLTVLWRTLRVALLTTLLAFIIAYPTALTMANASERVQSLFLVAMILPLSVGVIVKAFAWSILFRTQGFINQTLMALGVTDAPIRLLFTETALVIGAANVFLPFMVLPIYAVLRQLDRSLPDAASSLGASPWFRFRHVTWPLSLPGVIAGCSLTFSLAVSMYVIPSLIVGERQQTLSMLIARSYLYLRNEQLGSTISAILLVIAVSIVLLSSFLVTRHKPRHT